MKSWLTTGMLGFVALASGCVDRVASGALPGTEDASSGDASDVKDVPAASGDAGDAGEAEEEVRLHVVRDEQVPSRVYAFATQNGREVALLVDTGSQITFLSNPGRPDGEPNVGTIRLGGEERVLPGRPIAIHESDATIAGRPVVGFLGNDYFFERTREIDFAASRIRSVAPDAPVGWTPLPFENRHDFMFVRAQIDGEKLVLGFDTGAVHMLWLGRAPMPGDSPRSSQDANGTPIVLHLGTASLELEGEPARRIPIMRTLSFPSLQQSNEQMGGGAIDGLMGLSSVPDRKIRIDAARSTIWLK